MRNSTDHVTVWTIHPSDFDLSKSDLKLDHKQGWYWKAASIHPGVSEYRIALSALHRHFGVQEILWCLSTPIGWYRSTVEETLWELTLSTSAILDLFDENEWAYVVSGKKELDLDKLVLPREYPIVRKCEVLVRWPLLAGSRIVKLGSIKAETVTQLNMDYLNRLRLSQP